MTTHGNPPRIPLPRGWPQSVKVAMLHVISLAQFGMAYTRGWAISSPISRIRLKAENDRLKQHFWQLLCSFQKSCLISYPMGSRRAIMYGYPIPRAKRDWRCLRSGPRSRYNPELPHAVRHFAQSAGAKAHIQ